MEENGSTTRPASDEASLSRHPTATVERIVFTIPEIARLGLLGCNLHGLITLQFREAQHHVYEVLAGNAASEMDVGQHRDTFAGREGMRAGDGGQATAAKISARS